MRICAAFRVAGVILGLAAGCATAPSFHGWRDEADAWRDLRRAVPVGMRTADAVAAVERFGFACPEPSQIRGDSFLCEHDEHDLCLVRWKVLIKLADGRVDYAGVFTDLTCP